jgi:hypothetical protein
MELKPASSLIEFPQEKPHIERGAKWEFPPTRFGGIGRRALKQRFPFDLSYFKMCHDSKIRRLRYEPCFSHKGAFYRRNRDL